MTFATVWYVGARVNVDTEVSMRALTIGLVALVVGASAAMAADTGRSYPHHRRGGPPEWCNQGNETTGGMMECKYYTMQQCLISARGVGGTCIPNPYYEWAQYYRQRPYGWRY
jgi:hypothetical protein